MHIIGYYHVLGMDAPRNLVIDIKPKLDITRCQCQHRITNFHWFPGPLRGIRLGFKPRYGYDYGRDYFKGEVVQNPWLLGISQCWRMKGSRDVPQADPGNKQPSINTRCTQQAWGFTPLLIKNGKGNLHIRSFWMLICMLNPMEFRCQVRIPENGV